MSRRSRRQVRRWSSSFKRPRWHIISWTIQRWDTPITQSEVTLV